MESDGISLATIVAGSAGGLIVGFVTALLTGRRERHSQLRERMLKAADDYATGVQQVVTGLLDLSRKRRPADAGEALDEVHRLVAEADARIARIQLLFGPWSKPARYASQAGGDMFAAAGRAIVYSNAVHLEQSIEEPRDELAASMNVLEDRIEDFADAAWRDMQSPGRARAAKRYLAMRRAVLVRADGRDEDPEDARSAVGGD